MKLAANILENKKKIEEKVDNTFFDDINAWATKAKSVIKFRDKDAEKVANMLLSVALSLDEVDEKGAIKDLKSLEAKIKKLEIEK